MKLELSILSVTVIVLISLSILNYSGYCVSGQRFLTKGELIEVAVRDAYRSVFDIQADLDVTLDDYFNKRKIKEFIDSNPGCCKIIRNYQDYKASEADREKANEAEGYFYPTFWGRIWGDENYLIQVSYIGGRQNSVSFEQSAPRIVYRMIGDRVPSRGVAGW